ncbi:alcohol dehydrogenase catalytic domain-containing protein, partial [Candidatus Woesearchaeota archaeon]|nr:alcohol dehydrogenase catalytic domain-containing protein [Candidatus Woesearchaeota archaeon]
MADLLYEEGPNEESWAFEDVPAKMRAVKIKGDKEFYFVSDYPTPQVGTGEVLIKVARSGMCHTDVGAIEGKMNAQMGLKEGEFRIPGHEFAGRVVAVGDEVDSDEWKNENALALALYGFCDEEAEDRCVSCCDDQYNLCRGAVFTGIQVNGGFADYVALPAEHVLKISSSVSLDDAFPVGDALLTAQHAIDLIGADETRGYVAVYGGAGGLGVAVIANLLKTLNREKIISIDTREQFLQLQREKLGIHTINSMGEKGPRHVAKELKKLTKYGLTRVIDCVGTGGRISSAYGAVEKLVQEGNFSKETFQAALMDEFANKGTVMDSINAVIKGGQVCVIGFNLGQFMLYPVGNFMGREVGMTGPWGGPFETAERLLEEMDDEEFVRDSEAGRALEMLRGKRCPFTQDGFAEGYMALVGGQV